MISTQSTDETQPISFSVNKYGETICYANPDEDDKKIIKKDTDETKFIGRYEMRRALGHGAFGTVYLGYDAQLDREVAIKAPNLGSNEAPADEVIELFRQEARQLAQIKHPNIVVVHDVGFEEIGCYVVSEFIDGPNLNHWIQDVAPTWQEAVQIIASLADGLAAAHAKGVIHRDVKPANVIVAERPEGSVPILVDFGLAISKSTIGTAGTRRGDISGTPNYMSPEQASGEGHRIDGRTDIYSLGVVLYRLLTGQLPFVATDILNLLEQVVEDEPRPPRQFVKGISRELEEICLKAISKKIRDRYSTASDFAEDLRKLLVRDATDESTTVASRSQILQATPKSNAPLKILIAEDNEVSRVKLQADLEKWGHDVVACKDGEIAWTQFQKEKYSVVITDWMMPNVDGLELVKRIRETSQTASNYTYIIMLTAKAEKHDIVLGMGAGADDFLTKPFHRDELNVRLRAGKRIVEMTRAISKSGRRIKRGIKAAAKVQRSFLPEDLPEISGFKFAWKYMPCDDLGGDMLNVVPLDDTHTAVYVLDVNGSGIPASLLATNISRFISSATDYASILVDRETDSSTIKIVEPEEVAYRLNQQFSGHLENSQFFTLLYGVLNRETREFRYICAGHPPVFYQPVEGTPTMLDGLGLPIGVAPDNNDYTQESVTLISGDRLYLYSNGLLNTPRNDGELFGSKRFTQYMINNTALSIDDIIQNLVTEVDEFGENNELKDDLTILAIEAE